MPRTWSKKQIQNSKDTRPRPASAPAVDTLTLTYEVDAVLSVAREFFLKRTPELVMIYLRTYHGFDGFQISTPTSLGPEGCYVLLRSSGATALIADAERARKEIALEIGLSPAKFQSFLPEFDAEFLHDYRYFYYASCRIHHTKCVRPDHLVIHRNLRGNVKNPLTHVGRTRLQD